MFVTKRDILAQIKEVAPAGQTSLDASTLVILRELTAELLSISRDDAKAEIVRFREIRDRRFKLLDDRLRSHITGKKIIVTGGTGCIGTTLLAELTRLHPARLVSICRGTSALFGQRFEGVEYISVDVRDKAELERLFAEVKPDVVYHLAAQRDPSQAETRVVQTVGTNIFGTQNILACAKQHGAQVIYASTGKAVRPFTPDIYAATKKVGEWLGASAAVDGLLCSGVRFTHVVDNSIIMMRLHGWLQTKQPIRLHAHEVQFYLQSARESAQLLLCSGLDAEEGVFMLQAIRNLGWPADLLNLALGAIDEVDDLAPIYLAGYESGYEEEAYPVLYDPLMSGEVSPLINALEAPDVSPASSCEAFDRFSFQVVPSSSSWHSLRALRLTHEEGQVREELHRLGWLILKDHIGSVPPERRQRMVQRYHRWSTHQQVTPRSEHQHITKVLEESLE